IRSVYGYMSLGEGMFSAWFNGYWVEEFGGSGIEDPKGPGCIRHCNATEWWVQMKTKSGLIGWTNETEKFDGKDSLAESQSWLTRETWLFLLLLPVICDLWVSEDPSPPYPRHAGQGDYVPYQHGKTHLGRSVRPATPKHGSVQREPKAARK